MFTYAICIPVFTLRYDISCATLRSAVDALLRSAAHKRYSASVYRLRSNDYTVESMDEQLQIEFLAAVDDETTR